jgi:ABC-type tungstate transport system substrate-binding protein
MTTAIVENVGRGDLRGAVLYAVVLLALAFAVNAVLSSIHQRGAPWARP